MNLLKFLNKRGTVEFIIIGQRLYKCYVDFKNGDRKKDDAKMEVYR